MQIEFWFLKYHRASREDFTGVEPFTLFDLLNTETKIKISKVLSLKSFEIPVLLLTVSEEQFIVITTERFIRIANSQVEEISYVDFDRHTGYKSLLSKNMNGTSSSIKSEGYTQDFGLQKKNGEITYWEIPTGSAGFAFWNVTKKCELIGKKLKTTSE